MQHVLQCFAEPVSSSDTALTGRDTTLASSFTAYFSYNLYRAALNAGRSSQEKAVSLSVHLSNAWIMTKQKKDPSRFLYHTKDHVA